MSNNINDRELLNFLMENGTIDLDSVRKKMQEKKRQNLLDKHNYKISQGTDGRWVTYIEDNTKKTGRRAIAKKNRIDLENALIEYYERLNQEKDKKVKGNTTLRMIYPLWLQSRKHEVCSIGTVKKNDQDWKRYYLNDSIIDKPMEKLTIQELKDWAHKKIEDNHLNKRNYYNMAIIIKQCFQFAKDAEYISENTWEMVKINTKKLKQNEKKSSNEEIYYLDEQKLLISHCLELFQKNDRNITALAIPLLFITGLRIGELVSLKYDDIDTVNHIIKIRRAESVIYTIDDDCNFKYDGKQVLDHTKSDAGTRNIPYTSYASALIDKIKEASDKYGYYDEGYIFCPRSKRINANTIDKKLYNYCNAIGIDKKSAHKIRKTFISRLIHSGQIDIDTVCRIAGHSDMKTTFTSYCFSLSHAKEIQGNIEEVLKIV